MMPALPMTTRRFGRWTALHLQDPNRRERWVCRCDCGSERTVRASDLINGKSTNCGCVGREKLAARNLKHGASINGVETPTYRVWKHIIQRTTNERCKDYRYYGGRGIRVCERWLSFENFLADMGKRPDGLTIDRIDNDGDYEPGNCRWATMAVQNANKRAAA